MTALFYFDYRIMTALAMLMRICKCSATVITLVLGCSFSVHSQVLTINPNSVEAKSWIIFDSQTEQVIDSFAADEPRSPASLTKMMVAYLTLQAIQEHKISLYQVVTVSPVVHSVQWDESKMGLTVGDQVTVDQLLNGLIVMSANDAAMALAELIGGNVANFVNMMNQTAQQLHMQHSHFTNPSGITMNGHYSSAYDMVLLSQAIIKTTPLYLYYSKQPATQYKTLHHEATNVLLKRDSSVDGMKTGYTADAGYNLSLTANRIDEHTQQPRRLIVVVMGTLSKQKRADVASQLLNIAYRYTQNYPLVRNQQLIADIPTRAAKIKSYPLYIKPQSSWVSASLLPHPMIINASDYDAAQHMLNINQRFLAPQRKPLALRAHVQFVQPQLNAPINHNLHMATLQVTQFSQPLATLKIQHNPHLEVASIWQYWWQNITATLGAWIGHTRQPKIYTLQDLS